MVQDAVPKRCWSVMNAIYEHPSLSMQVTPEQRDRAESWLKDAYADGE